MSSCRPRLTTVFSKLAGGPPLHFASTHIAADKVLAIAQEDAVADGVNIRGREVCNASVAGVLAV